MVDGSVEVTSGFAATWAFYVAAVKKNATKPPPVAATASSSSSTGHFMYNSVQHAVVLDGGRLEASISGHRIQNGIGSEGSFTEYICSMKWTAISNSGGGGSDPDGDSNHVEWTVGYRFDHYRKLHKSVKVKFEEDGQKKVLFPKLGAEKLRSKSSPKLIETRKKLLDEWLKGTLRGVAVHQYSLPNLRTFLDPSAQIKQLKNQAPPPSILTPSPVVFSLSLVPPLLLLQEDKQAQTFPPPPPPRHAKQATIPSSLSPELVFFNYEAPPRPIMPLRFPVAMRKCRASEMVKKNEKPTSSISTKRK
jgi:hypothetical protein